MMEVLQVVFCSCRGVPTSNNSVLLSLNISLFLTINDLRSLRQYSIAEKAFSALVMMLGLNDMYTCVSSAYT